MAKYTVTLTRLAEYVVKLEAGDENEARALAAALLGVPDNGDEHETDRPRTVRPFRLRGESWTLRTEERS